MKRTIKIGTRDSQLALWQAHFVQNEIESAGHQTELVFIKSEGEIDLVRPLYELGVQGIFTRTLDAALLDGRIDIAVHSLKDVPTQTAEGLYQAAVPARGNSRDLLITQKPFDPDFSKKLVIASSSLRRRAQWLNRYPHHQMEPIRGNINSRLGKLMSSEHWSGTIMAAAGIERIKLEIPHKIEVDWMLPAPAQGALGVYCRETDQEIIEICSALNHPETMVCVNAERLFLRTLMGGCTMPIAAHAYLDNDQLVITGNVLSVDGTKKAEVTLHTDVSEQAGKLAAEQILTKGGREILEELRNSKME